MLSVFYPLCWEQVGIKWIPNPREFKQGSRGAAQKKSGHGPLHLHDPSGDPKSVFREPLL